MRSIVAVIALVRFRNLRIVTQPRFHGNSFYVKLTTFCTAENTKFDRKLITYSKNLSKINITSRWTVFEILPTSTTVICIQRSFT